MRTMTENEYTGILDENGEKDEGCEVHEAKVSELVGYGTTCGHVGNKALTALGPKFGERLVRGWFAPATSRFVLGSMEEIPPTVHGMVHIQCEEDEAGEIEFLVGNSGGSLRDESQSAWPGFWIFESE